MKTGILKDARTRKWWALDEKFEKEHRRVEEMIKRKDNKALGRWLSAFGKSDKSLWSPDTKDKYEKNAWNR